MPQMAPMSWLTLFIMFSLILLLTNSMNFYYTNLNYKKEIMTNNKKSMNWKW